MVVIRENFKVKIKGDAGIYDVWAIDFLNLKVQVYRAGSYEWIQFEKCMITYDA